MVQAGGCGGVTEIAERSRDRRGAAVTDVPCVSTSETNSEEAGQAVRVPAVAAARHVGPKCGRDCRSQDWTW